MKIHVLRGQATRERFLRDPPPRRLGNIAANLARIGSFSDNPAHEAAIGRLLLESKHFIEWSAPHASLDVQVELAESQLQIVRWERRLRGTLADSSERASMAGAANRWSERLLERSGLLR